ncbi:polymeric immunoglobulin receptor-like isoform X2 [Silurus meridionalis]|uniref:polymeric immunoglobulin receptor-like isoform X2 n=1 Tax=Silurus meridionalis TaxID=175797 RepID=UPI001EEBB20F|nr:polymeric immunoglobulin receptor-like isoform X2 [Silurus meridionalis]
MKILLIFKFCLIIAGSDAVTTVTGYRGRSVQIKCHYESGYEENNKYLCRGECPGWPSIKDIPVQSGSPAEDTRFSLYDDTTAKIFTVTITDLRAEDANTYWCVVQQKGPNIYTELQLLVVDDSSSSSVSTSTNTTYSASSHIMSPSVHTETPPATAGSDAVTTVTGYRGRSVQIKCHYESGYEKNNKYLCRGECPRWPAIKDIPVQSGSPAEDTRFSLYDDTTAKIFTITITDLRAEDANTYWCVVQQKGPNIYTELQLLVVDDPASSSPHIMNPSMITETPPATAGSDAVTTVTGYRGRSVQIKCHYESGYEKNNKYLCRGECPPWPAIKDIPVQSGSPAEDTRFSLYDDTTAKIFTITITDLRAEDANTYWCVVQQKGPNIYTELQLLVVDDPASSSPHIMNPSMITETPPATVTGYRGRSVQIKCHYDSGYEENNKYLCRGECPHWPRIKDIPVQSKSPAKDTRFSLYDDTTAKIFTITITDLRAEDAKTYWCGIERSGPLRDIYTKLQLLVKMVTPTEKVHHKTTARSSNVTGYRGRSVQIKCHYDSGYEENNKYLCRGECPHWPRIKDIPVQSKSPAKDTRFSLYDDTTAKIFTITITDLRAEDAKTYWCGIERSGPLRDIYTKLQLLVKMVTPTEKVHHKTTARSSNVTGYRGRSVQIKCHYESGYEKNNKYLCRGECPHWPANKDIPVQSGSPSEDTRFSLYDDTTPKIFTITITDLRAKDANTYWCGIQRTGPFRDIYTELKLLVKTDDSANSTASPITRFTSTSLSVHAEITHTSSSSTITAANLLNDAKDPTIASVPQKFPTSAFIIAVSVLLELLLIAILFTFSVQRKKKTMTQASFSALSPHSSSDIFMVPCPVSENEEVSNSLYSAVQLPSTPSEIYSNTGLPTIPSDPSPPVYAAIKHPGHQDVYSTAQLPSDSSVSAAQSSDIKSGSWKQFGEDQMSQYFVLIRVCCWFYS